MPSIRIVVYILRGGRIRRGRKKAMGRTLRLLWLGCYKKGEGENVKVASPAGKKRLQEEGQGFFWRYGRITATGVDVEVALAFIQYFNVRNIEKWVSLAKFDSEKTPWK
jgi:hypothetical protein